MKIAQYHGINGKRDHVTFAKGPDPRLSRQVWDRVYPSQRSGTDSQTACPAFISTHPLIFRLPSRSCSTVYIASQASPSASMM